MHLSADRLAALIGVMAGDAVPELTAMKWQKKSTGLCSCGEPEDLHHRWWRCPRRHALRLQALRGAKPAALAALPQCTVLYGIPVELPAVARWREGLPADAPVQMPSSRRYYPDGSCLRPRLPEVRVAAWAVVGCVNGVWWHRAGPCPGEQTIGRAELAAIVQILNGAEPGVILTDCEGVQRKCASIQCGSITREELGKGTNADLWARAWEPLRGPQGWTVQWLPSHRSLPEALAAGVSQEDWHGNDLADAAAKEEARRHDLPAEVLEQWADRQAANEAVWRLIAESQVAHLSARPRRHDGAAAKARKRKAPARPNRRVRPRAVAAAVEPAPAQLPQSVLAKAAAAEAAAAAARHAMAVAAAREPAVLPQVGRPQVGPPQDGFPQLGLPQVGLPRVGPPQDGFPQLGLPQVGLPRVGLPHVGLPQVGPPQDRFPQLGLPQVGPPRVGLPQGGQQVPEGVPEAAAAAPEEAVHQPPLAEDDAAAPVAPAAPAEVAAPAEAGVQPQAAAPAFVWPDLPVIAGVHHMVVEQGPGGPFEWTKKAAGTIMCKWSCNSCGMKAGNSSRLLEVLRKPCGALAAHCSWDKVNHDTEVVADRVICRRCGTTRQRYVDLSGQACPVRRCMRAGAEVPDGTAVYGAWVCTLQAMHAHAKAVQRPAGEAAAAAVEPAAAEAPADGAAAAERTGDGDGGGGPPPVPVSLRLRPFREHACVVAGRVEFCMRCACKAPRFRTAEWRASCCDGDAPIGGVPKHILAAIAADCPQWPVRQAQRVLQLVEAARAHGRSVAAMSLRRPKRRQAGGRQDS